jgi:hypothetical protein
MKTKFIGRVALIGASCVLLAVTALADGIISGVVISGPPCRPEPTR